MAFTEVGERRVVAAAEAFAIIFTRFPGDRRFAEFSGCFDVRRELVIEVPASGFNPIVESLALNITELLRRHIPPTTVMVGVILGQTLLHSLQNL